MKRTLLLMLSLACLTGCAKQAATDYGGRLIEAPGTYKCFNDQLAVNVVHAPGSKINYTVGNKKAAAGPATAAIDESVPWVIFPESPARVWIYDGAKDVTLIEIDETGGSKFTSSQVVPDVLKRAPAELVRHLPAKVIDEPS